MIANQMRLRCYLTGAFKTSLAERDSSKMCFFLCSHVLCLPSLRFNKRRKVQVVEAAPDEEEAPPPKEDDLPAEGEPVAEGLEERTMQRPRRRWGRYTQPGAVAEGAEGDGDEEDGEEDDEGRRSRRERSAGSAPDPILHLAV